MKYINGFYDDGISVDPPFNWHKFLTRVGIILSVIVSVITVIGFFISVMLLLMSIQKDTRDFMIYQDQKISELMTRQNGIEVMYASIKSCEVKLSSDE